MRFGRYELLRPLGRGGMAELFLARYRGPQGFEKRLVIKRVLPSLAGDARLLRRFVDEARIHVSLSHGNLVPVFDFGRVGNRYFIAMEHVPGCDLASLLQAARDRGAPLAPSLVAHLGVEACRGLAYVHRRGFVHRDVAPRNLLVSTDGSVKLADFGVALATDGDAAPGVSGTLAYMAPEQARGERPDGRADLYALGLVLAEALLGHRVRPPGSHEETLALARAAAPVLVDGPLAEPIARATAASPDDRFPDADAMLVALESAGARAGASGVAAARELSSLVAAWFPAAEEAGAGDSPPDVAATPGGETYFRDNHTEAEFLEELLGDPPSPTRRRLARRLGFALVGASAVLAAGLVSARSLRRPPHVAPTPSANAHAPSANAALPSRALAAPAPAAVARHDEPPPARRPRRPATGTLLVECTPWCFPFVDEVARGEDGKHHEIVVPVGAHRVSARRLGDRQERTVEVPAAGARVQFVFE